MGVIIRMNSKKFFKEFLPNVKNTDEYQFILISEDIKIKDIENKPKNIMSFPRLIPTPSVISLYVSGESKPYKKAYMNQLQDPEVEAFISVMVKAAVVYDMKVVILCSKSEWERKYVKLLCEYIEATYQLKTYSWDKYLEKGPEKAGSIKNKDEVTKILGRKFESMERHGVQLNADIDKDKIRKKLEKLSRKELRKIAADKRIKVDEDMGKKKLIKKILKKIAS
jgi:vacuolar-type H+-ATPase subunit F/Vma7